MPGHAPLIIKAKYVSPRNLGRSRKHKCVKPILKTELKRGYELRVI